MSGYQLNYFQFRSNHVSSYFNMGGDLGGDLAGDFAGYLAGDFSPNGVF
jgi:hypothetical protein